MLQFELTLHCCSLPKPSLSLIAKAIIVSKDSPSTTQHAFQAKEGHTGRLRSEQVRLG